MICSVALIDFLLNRGIVRKFLVWSRISN